ncbi:oxalate--CoA ligase [Eucalyptus grandis]|uniref:oxalate--CoA ligase n=1 Tax=Eucalyptus grandis TaxID=71139 RepID=UPI00192EBC9A|nr:oxalate--CoA ligase [Eucalyptus grandis]
MGEELTLTGLLKKAAQDFPDRRAVSACGKFGLTHAQLRELVDHAAALLAASGIVAGNVVALAFPNTIEFVILFLAVIRCRATAAPLDPIYTAKEFKFYLSHSRSKFLLIPQEGNLRARSAASELNIPRLTAKLHSANSRITLSSTDVEPSLDSMSKVVNDPSDIALLLHSSSATGCPKRMLLTQRNLASSVRNIKWEFELTESDSTVIVLPLFHVHSLVAGLLSSLAAGAAVALPAVVRFLVPTFLGDMKSYNATWYTADASLHQIILDRHLSKPKPAYPKLRFIVSCSVSLAPSIRDRLKEAFSAPVVEAYAMTEATRLTASDPLPEDGEQEPRSVGRPVGQEMTTSDEHGAIQAAAAGVSCEVCIRGLNVTEGYKNNPKSNKQAFRFRLFHTGRVGYIRSDAGLLRSRFLPDKLEVASAYRSNDTPEGNNAPKTTKENKTETERGEEEGGPSLKLTVKFEKFSGPKQFSYEELMIAIADRKILGRGGFGVVYEGHIGDACTHVAVKELTSNSGQGIKEYESEVMALSQLRHKNLVPLIGYCHEADKFILVYKFMSNGSLEDHLFNGGTLLNWESRYRIAKGLALALYYLHEQCDQYVIHRDIKSSNVMLDEKFNAKLGDFGLARLVDHARGPITTQLIGTWGYAAPEYCVTGRASKETDVYSFGVVLLEIGSGRRVIDSELGPGLAQWLWMQYGPDKLAHAVDSRLGKDFDKKQAEALMMVGLWCAHSTATSRPSIEDAMAVLNLKAKIKPRELPLKITQSPHRIDRKVSPGCLGF